MQEQITGAILDACKVLYGLEPVASLDRPEEQFGDFASNVALQLSGQLARNPREIAQEIAGKLQENDLFTSAGVAGPGFINLTLMDSVLIGMLSTEPQRSLTGLKVLVEYSDPNPFKPLHAGHLYTTIVGDVIARLVEHAGAETVRLNYGGDVGLHVAKTMWAIERTLGGATVEKLSAIDQAELPQWLGERYAEGHAAYEDDETSRAEIIETNKRVYGLHAQKDENSDFAQSYWYCRAASYDYFQTLYKQLEVHAFDRFIAESEVTQQGVQAVQEQLDRGVFEHSDGAVIFDGEKHGLHKRVFINSEGLPTYETKDVGLSLTKWQDYRFDESIIITANEQAQYMAVVIKAISQFAPEPAEKTRHITHGVVKLAGGVKMSSRAGNVLLALDMLDAARTAGSESGNAGSEETVLAAVKYALLKNRVGGDIIYDPAESVAMEGNSGPYLQYAHARAKSILRKSEVRNPKSDVLINTSLEAGERSLLRKLTEYQEVIDKATHELAPHHICSYLYELAQTFNRFYEQNQVIGDVRETERLALVTIYAETLQRGLQLLGIHAPEHM